MKAETLRIDKLLFFLRFARTRSIAQGWVGNGHIRIGGRRAAGGRRIERTSHGVAVGDVVTLPLGSGVLVFELMELPTRRGPPAEANACYRLLDTGLPVPAPLDAAHAFAIAAANKSDQTTGAMGSQQQ